MVHRRGCLTKELFSFYQPTHCQPSERNMHLLSDVFSVLLSLVRLNFAGLQARVVSYESPVLSLAVDFATTDTDYSIRKVNPDEVVLKTEFDLRKSTLRACRLVLTVIQSSPSLSEPCVVSPLPCRSCLWAAPLEGFALRAIPDGGTDPKCQRLCDFGELIWWTLSFPVWLCNYFLLVCKALQRLGPSHCLMSSSLYISIIASLFCAVYPPLLSSLKRHLHVYFPFNVLETHCFVIPMALCAWHQCLNAVTLALNHCLG